MTAETWMISLLGVIATVNVAQFGHQLIFTRRFARHRALPPDRAHGGDRK